MNAQSSAGDTLRPGAFMPAGKGPVGSVVDLEALLHLIGQGDRRAFRTLYDRVAGRMLSSARRILGDGDSRYG